MPSSCPASSDRSHVLGSRTVAGIDLTFTPVKRVTAVWVPFAPVHIAKRIEAANNAAGGDMIRWLE